MTARLLAVVAVLFALAVPGTARAQGVVFASSDPTIVIHSTFTGQPVTLFGNVEAGTGDVPATGPFDVVVVVRGPGATRSVAETGRRAGLVMQTAAALYQNLPGYYAVMSSQPLEPLLDPDTPANPSLSLLGVAARARAADADPAFDAELVRLMSEEGLFQHDPRGVTFISPTSFATRIILPSSVPNGAYLARVYVIAGGSILATAETSFLVRTEGFERLVAESATVHPVLYGLAAVMVALSTGWLGGALFRR